MNERIKELLNQCTDPTLTKPWPLIDAEKFAELIVRECMLVIEEEAQHIHAEGTIEAIVNLEKHFGVEA